MSSASRRQKKSAALASLRQRRQQGLDLDDVEIKILGEEIEDRSKKV